MKKLDETNMPWNATFLEVSGLIHSTTERVTPRPNRIRLDRIGPSFTGEPPTGPRTERARAEGGSTVPGDA